ncbi:MAG: integrase [Rickettsiales bacterium]|jgi:integrase
MNKINFSNTSLKELKNPEKSRTYYRDIKESGLSIYITSNDVRTFFIRKRVNGKDEKIIIGNFPDLSVENARKQARIIKGQIAIGENPNEEKSKLRSEITLVELIDSYVEKYSKKHKITWWYDDSELRRLSSNFHKSKISTISNDDIRKLHAQIADKSGIYQANRFLAVFKSMFNKAIEWGYQGSNPAVNIKKFKEQSRDRFIQPDELPRFFESLNQEENEIARDYIYLSLYTGARQGNVLAMRWEDINLTTKQWRIPKTKNGESLTIPLLDEALEILRIRREENPNLGLKSFQAEWVFPSLASKSGHLEEPKKAWKRILLKAGIENLRIHDIRRTLGSYQAISGSSLPIIGKSLGHKSSSATQIYARMNLDPVRESLSKAVGLMNKYGLKKEG